MNWKAFPPEELSNPEYQEYPAVSGSGLATIYKQSPAHFKYQPKETTKALTFGIAAHAIILEPEAFAAEFVRDVDAEQYPDALVTQQHMKDWLKERGQKVSGTKPDLTARILELEPDTHILDSIRAEFAAANEDKTIVPPVDFGAITTMRAVIMQDEQMATMLNGGYSEYSLIGDIDGTQVKTRPDLITSAGGIIQYKTTLSCHPEEFGRKVDNYGYLLKAALEWECFTRTYGVEPKYYIFLAQEKKEPFVWKPYNLTPDALSIGRVQLESALNTYDRCVSANKWPGYGADIDPILIPDWMLRQYNIQ